MFFLCILLFVGMMSFAQSQDLAQNYLDQGEYEKAKSVFENLHKKNPRNQQALMGYVESLQALEDFETAEDVLKNYLKNIGDYPNIQVELGYLYQKQNDTAKANAYYQKAMQRIEKQPNIAYSLGKTFQKYSLLELATATYEKAQAIKPSTNNTIQLAKIYGEQSQFDKMFDNYMSLLVENPNYFDILNRNFGEYITENSDNKANKALRTILLRRNQENPNILFNEMLSWLFVQQNDFDKAFAQERAIFQRGEQKKLERIIDLAQIAKSKSKLESAEEMLKFAVENTNSKRQLITAMREYLLVKSVIAKPSEYEDIEYTYQKFLKDVGRNKDTFLIQKDLVEFIATKQNKIDAGLAEISKIVNQELYKQQIAELKILNADLLVRQSKFSRALLLYTQVEKLIPNSDLAREAKFKVAKTSYFKGDFDWALTQLEVLKTSASQLTANDAMELALLIKDNSQEDSTRTDLKLVAEAGLQKFQNQTDEALNILESVLENHKTESIVDEVLFRIGNIYLDREDFKKAATYFQKIVDQHSDDILSDNANFALGNIYLKHLEQPDQAKTYFEYIIFNHPDSIYFVDARKQFRKLRGDKIQ
ncbi:MAG: tetratricopeptide repeat protein [Psychroflexus sp.]